MMGMPGESWKGPLEPLTPAQAALVPALRKDVEELAGRIGFRNHISHGSLREAAAYVEGRLRAAGLPAARQTYKIGDKDFDNIEASIPGVSVPGEIVVVGAHYDAVIGSPGANDNASGVAALLALAAVFAKERPARTLRFVGFVNEEPPHFQTEAMGSLVCARGCRERNENVVAMVSLETLGCYSDEKGSQSYPAPLSLFYPDRGDFIAFVGNVGSRELVRRAIGEFRKSAKFPSEGGALPGWLPGIGWSDHWAFWEAGYPGIMVTDTAPFRYSHYHGAGDTPDRVDFERLARVVEGLIAVVRDLAVR